ncbi:MAG: DNA-binding transcriptional regulator Fis [Gammaproteobacteria bacterium]|jgi:Fis family transcriptional regulator|nr:DNA-binding transcriptional regulator Fis [Gammaproteobacteria bacterium]
MSPHAKDSTRPLSHTIEEALTHFINEHHTHLPKNLHALAISMVEKPLLKLVMQKTEQNQSLAAKILGLNRATLRKKLTDYHLI